MTGLPDPLTSQGETVGDVYSLFLTLALAVLGFVLVLLAFVVLRYRRRDDRLPSQEQYHVGLEAAYTVIPLLLLVGLFAYTVRTIGSIQSETADPDLVVEVVGFQWQWQFTYVEAGVVVVGDQPIEDARTGDQPYPVLVVPADATVRFTLESADVIHSFWFPGFRYKEDAIPGTSNTFEVAVTGEPGLYPGGMCAEFCGAYHARMGFDLEILPSDEFDAWLAAQAEEATP